MNKRNRQNGDETINVGQMLISFFRYKKLFFGLTFCFAVAAVLAVLLIPKEYKTTSTMLLVADKGDMMAEMKMLKSSGLGSMLGGGGSSVNVDDELAAIASKEILGKAIKNLNLQVSMQAHLGLKFSELYKASPVRIEFTQAFLDNVERPKKLDILIEGASKAALKLSMGTFESLQTEYKQLPAQFDTPWGIISLTRNEGSPHTDLSSVEVTVLPFQMLYESYQKQVTVHTIDPMSDVLEFYMEDQCRERSADLLSEMMALYNAYTLQKKQTEAGKTARFVHERMDEINKELSDYEYKIEQYKKQHKFTDIETDVKVQLTSSEAYKAKESEVQVQLRLVEYVLGYLNNPDNLNSVIPVILSGADKESPASREIAAYNLLMNDLVRLKQFATDANPALVALNEQISKQRSNLVETIKTLHSSLELSAKELDKAGSEYKTWIAKLPTNEREFLELKRQQQIKEKLLIFMLQKYEETGVSNNPYTQAGLVIDMPHHSYKHTFPKGSIMLPAFLILAFMIFFVIVCIKEYVLKKTVSMRDILEGSLIPVMQSVTDLSMMELKSRMIRGMDDGRFVMFLSSVRDERCNLLVDKLVASLVASSLKVAVIDNEDADARPYSKETVARQALPVVIKVDISNSSSTHVMALKADLAAAFDVVLIKPHTLDHTFEACEFSLMADSVYGVLRPEVTKKQTMEKYNEWYEQGMFKNFRLLINALS